MPSLQPTSADTKTSPSGTVLTPTLIAESIAKITAISDPYAFDRAFSEVLLELLQVAQIERYMVLCEYNSPAYYLTLEYAGDNRIVFEPDQSPPRVTQQKKIKGFEQCVEKKMPIFIPVEDGTHSFLFPINNHLQDVVGIYRISKLTDQPNYQQLVLSLFTIYQNHLQLIFRSEHDTLTGLLNRRTFDRDLEKVLGEWHKVSDNNNSMETTHPCFRLGKHGKGNWLAVIDIDHFKRINDKFGHLYGDEVLLLLSNIMRKTFRTYDKLFRFGGEEFVVILRTTSKVGALGSLERFREAVEAYEFPQLGHVTVSIGYVQIADQSIPAEVLGHADEALYYVKGHGRNQIASYEELVEAGEVSATHVIESSSIEYF